jgi:hypothetical protein
MASEVLRYLFSSSDLVVDFGIFLPTLSWYIMKATAKVPAANPVSFFVIFTVSADIIVHFELLRSIPDHLRN